MNVVEYTFLKNLGIHNIDAADLSNPNLLKTHLGLHSEEYLEVVKRHQTSAIHLFEYLSRVQPRIMLDAYTKFQ